MQVGIPRHDGLPVVFRLVQDGLLEVQDFHNDFIDLSSEVEAKVHSHLVVPAAGGVEALARSADFFRQEGFHIHVDVLVVGGKFDFSGLDTGQNVFQALDDLVFILLGDDSTVGKHGRMGYASFYIFPIHPGIKLNGGVEVIYQTVRFLAETAAP